MCDEILAECSFRVARFRKPPYELSGDEGDEPMPVFDDLVEVADRGVLAIGCGVDAVDCLTSACFDGTAGAAVALYGGDAASS